MVIIIIILWFLEFSLALREIWYHRMTEVAMDLWRSSGPMSLLKQGHLEMFA